MRFEYDEEISRGAKGIRFGSEQLSFFSSPEIATFDLLLSKEYRRLRAEITADEWIDLLNPQAWIIEPDL